MSAPRTDARRRGRRLIAPLCAVALALAVTLVPAERSQAAAAPATRWWSAGLLAGSAQPVARMADYQWDVRPHPAWGAQLLVGLGPFAAGTRYWRGGTTQSLALAGTTDPAVRSTSLELVARARLVQWRSVQCMATASGGRLALTYQPDRITVVSGGNTIEVAFTPIHEWVGGAGLACSVPLGSGCNLGIEAERRLYSLDTAHRSGTAFVEARERLGDWSARFELSRAWDW